MRNLSLIHSTRMYSALTFYINRLVKAATVVVAINTEFINNYKVKWARLFVCVFFNN